MNQLSGMYQKFSNNKLNPLNSMQHTTSISSFGKSSVNKNVNRLENKMKNKQITKNKNQYELRERLSKSIEDISQIETTIDSIPLFADRKTLPNKNNCILNKQILIQNCEDNDEIFGKSYKKLNQMYSDFHSKNTKSVIEQQLSDILELIKEERTVINKKMAQLQYKQSKAKIFTVETAQNTEQIISNLEQRHTKSIDTQTQLIQNFQMANSQTYSKLIKILEDMNINSKQILPQDIKIDEINQAGKEKVYQQLKQSQIITVQKFVIKKLVQKITALEISTSK